MGNQRCDMVRCRQCSIATSPNVAMLHRNIAKMLKILHRNIEKSAHFFWTNVLVFSSFYFSYHILLAFFLTTFLTDQCRCCAPRVCARSPFLLYFPTKFVLHFFTKNLLYFFTKVSSIILHKFSSIFLHKSFFHISPQVFFYHIFDWTRKLKFVSAF